jgi:dihydroorotate dehydrogenase (NAD+) catalytic subunit
VTETLQDKAYVDAARLKVRLGRLALTNPVMPASGCFGPELAPLIPLHRLGAVVTKTVFSAVRSGNPAHRLAETPTGMLNAVGIPSPGLDGFRSRVLPEYRATGAPVIVSIGGLAVGDYFDVAESLAQEHLAALEINVSCPNLEHGGLEIGSDPRAVEEVTRGVRERAPGVPVITKLTPNVSSVPELARAAEAGGADAVTVANTFVGLSIDLSSRAPALGNTTGGLSGPAVKPLVLRLVHHVSRAVGIPVVGCGGVRTADDVAEYLIAGASAVQVGTATFTRPSTMIEILDGLPAVLDRLHADRSTDLVSTLARPCPDNS